MHRKEELDQLRIKREYAIRLLAQNDLIAFSKRVWYGYEPSPHHIFIAKILEKAENKEPGYDRIVLHEPPQHGKSLQVSTLFPAWHIGNNPDDSIIITSYGDQHAVSFSRNIRNIIAEKEFEKIFSKLSLAQDRKAANQWNLNHPYHGSMVASGIFGRITGVGADLMIIDDPYKNRIEAESKLHREKIIEQYRSTLKTRQHKDCIVILVMTRWHKGDIASWLLNKNLSGENFKYIKLPALAEDNDIMGRTKYQPLWKKRFPQPLLLDNKRTLGTYNWNSMYQGNPTSPEGNLFKRKFFKTIKKAPENLYWVRYWDLAATEDRKGDYTCSVKIAQDAQGNIYVDGMFRRKWSFPKVKEIIKSMKIQEPDVLYGVESQGIQKGMVQMLWSDPDLVDAAILGIPVAISKSIRALSAMSKLEAGKLYLVEGGWNNDFIEELVDFDTGEYDDQVDALSGCFHMLGLAMGQITNLDDLDLEDEETKTEQEQSGEKIIEEYNEDNDYFSNNVF